MEAQRKQPGTTPQEEREASHIDVVVEPELRDFILASAAKQDVSPSEWMHQAAEQRLVRELAPEVTFSRAIMSDSDFEHLWEKNWARNEAGYRYLAGR